MSSADKNKIFFSIKKHEDILDFDGAMEICLAYLKAHPNDIIVKKELNRLISSVEKIEHSSSNHRDYTLESIQFAFDDLNNKDHYIRINACVKLGLLGSKKAVNPLINVLNDDSAHVRENAVIALGKLGSKKSILSIIDSLDDKSVNVRVASAEALGKFKDKRALVPLNKLLNDKKESVRKAAEKSIKNINPEKRDFKIPKWTEYNPSLKKANKRQKKFYDEWFIQMEKFNYLDVGENLSYIYVYVNSVTNEFINDRDINKLITCLKKIENEYNLELTNLKVQAYRLIGDNENALKTEINAKRTLNAALRLTFLISNNDFLDSDDIVEWFSYYLTPFGVSYKKEIKEIISELLDQFNEKRGKSILRYFIDEFNRENLDVSDLERLECFFLNEDRFHDLKLAYKNDQVPIYNNEVIDISTDFQGFGGIPETFPFDDHDFKKLLFRKPKKIIIPQILMEGLKDEIKRIIIDSENIFRESKGLPKIGEGWISETELYYLIKEEFPNEKIIHHGRPKWLGRQHLDVYFSKINLGIEYQGEQHNEPIEFFGGEEGLKKRIKLDEKKKLLCKKNNCDLIFVYPNYDFEEVKNKIENLISKKKL